MKRDANGISTVEAEDLARWPRRSGDAHKWRSAVWIVAGSPGLYGAATLAATGAFRAGAGYVTLSVPGSDASIDPTEAVCRPIADVEWDRHGALVIGPGMNDRVVARAVLAGNALPAVVDAAAIAWFQGRSGPTILTPHDGEFQQLTGKPLGEDRVGAVKATARDLDAIVLLKGPTTVIADPAGQVYLVEDGDARLATAGTGDVLSGVIGAGLALGLEPMLAAALGAELHAVAATSPGALRSGFMASDLPLLIAKVLDG
ncbi:MAG: NAD(P)H-hydrate dehydratase [Acidimicrobiales bacterium]|nr:NAD(P)H-hydrate dehydratase [Acidimicrobiales bacterium]